MNLPIRPEAPPLDLPLPTPTADKASKPASGEDFAAVLNQELGGPEGKDDSKGSEAKKRSGSEKKEAPKAAGDAWTLFGVAPATLPIIQLTVPSAQPVPVQNCDSPKSLVPECAQAPPAGAAAAAPVLTPSKTAAKPIAEQPADEKQVVLDKLIAGLSPKPEKASDQQKIPESTPSPPGNSVENALKPAKEAPEGNGILVAQEKPMLHPSPKQDEIAASGKGEVPARREISNSEPGQHEIKRAAAELQKISVLNEAAGQKREEQPIRIDFSPAESFSVQKHSAEVIAPSELTPAHTTSADSVIETIQNHVQFLRYTGNDRLELVFRPDKDTQLFIQVAKVNGEIQVQARWERGELAQVSAHWNHVQQSLASQGIRVEPLGQSSNLSSQFHSDFSGRKQQPGRDGSHDKLISLENSGPVPVKPKSSRSKTSGFRRGGGWQGWA